MANRVRRICTDDSEFVRAKSEYSIYLLRAGYKEAVYWDAVYVLGIFLDWMGFDREAKRYFLIVFSHKRDPFGGILYLRRSYESRESVVY